VRFKIQLIHSLCRGTVKIYKWDTASDAEVNALRWKLRIAAILSLVWLDTVVVPSATNALVGKKAGGMAIVVGRASRPDGIITDVCNDIKNSMYIRLLQLCLISFFSF